MYSLVFDEAKNLMLIHIIGLRPAITLDSTSYHLQMAITGFFFKEMGSNDESGVIILGQD
jgi:hypothetical protein